MEKKEKKTLNRVLSVLLFVAVVAFMVAYYYFDWVTQAQDINRYLDATIRGICTIILASNLSKFVAFMLHRLNSNNQRRKTVTSLVSSLIRYAIIITALVLVLTYFIDDTSSLFTGMGMLGMVIGLGCNKLIADVVAGIFIVLEGTFQVGDKVIIGGTEGTIQEVGIRSTKMLDDKNNVKIINNSSISNVSNMSQTNSGAMIQVGIDYSESLERVEKILAENLPLFKDEIPGIIAGPFYKGVVDLSDSAVVLRIIAFTKEEDRGSVKRKMLRKVKLLFDENNVSFPYPQLTVNNR